MDGLLNKLQTLTITNETSSDLKELLSNCIVTEKHYLVDYSRGFSVDMYWRMDCLNYVMSTVQNFDLPNEVIFIAINIIDRYMSKVNLDVDSEVVEHALVTALWIATKVETLNVLGMPELTLYMNHLSNFSINILKETELDIILKLSGFLYPPTELWYLDFYMAFIEVTTEQRNFGKFLCVLSLYDVTICAQYPPSKIAMAAVILSNLYYEKTVYPEALQDLTEHNVNTYTSLVKTMNEMMNYKAEWPLINHMYSKTGFASMEYREFTNLL